MRNLIKKKWNILRSDRELQKILTNMNWLFLDKAIQISLAFFVGIWVIRYLGPERYGVLSYASAIVAFFGIFAKLGLDAIVVRELVNAEIKKEILLGTSFYLKLCGGLIATSLAIFTAMILQDDDRMIYAVAIISASLIFQASDVVDFWFQSRVTAKHIAYVRSFSCIASAVMKIWLILGNMPLVWFMVVIVVESIFVSVGFAIAYIYNKNIIGKWTYDARVAKKLLVDSWPLILSGFAAMVYLRIDQIMIGNMLGYQALGSYSVAVGLSEAWYFIPIIINNSVFPAIIYTKKRDEELYQLRLQKLFDMMAWTAFIIALPITFFSHRIIATLYGVEYTQAADVLVIYIWAGVFVFLGSARTKWMIAENLQKHIFYFAGISGIVNIVLNIFFIQSYGINGAAYATLISYIIAVILMPFMFKDTRSSAYMLLKSLNILRVFVFRKK